MELNVKLRTPPVISCTVESSEQSHVIAVPHVGFGDEWKDEGITACVATPNHHGRNWGIWICQPAGFHFSSLVTCTFLFKQKDTA